MTVQQILSDRLKALGVTRLPVHVLEVVEAHALNACKGVINRKVNPASVAKLFAGAIRPQGSKGAVAPLASSNREGGHAD